MLAKKILLLVIMIVLLNPNQFVQSTNGNTHVVLFVQDNTNSFDVGQVIHLKGQIIQDISTPSSGIANAHYQIIYADTRSIIQEGYTDSQGLFSYDWTPKAADEGTNVQIIGIFSGSGNYDYAQSPPLQMTIVSSYSPEVTNNTNSLNPITQTPSSTNNLEVSTDKLSYTTGDKIIISGFANPVLQNYPTVMLIIKSPSGSIVTAQQLDVSPNGAFSTTIPLLGPLWSKEGSYTIFTQYAEFQSTPITFRYEKTSELPPSETQPNSNLATQPFASSQPLVSSQPTVSSNSPVQNQSGISSSSGQSIQQIPQILSSFSEDLIPIVGIVGALAVGIITYFALTRRKRKSYSYEELERIKRNEREEIEKAKKQERERQREKERQREREKARENERYEKKADYVVESTAELEKKQREREAEKAEESRIYAEFKKKEQERIEENMRKAEQERRQTESKRHEEKRVQEPPKQYGFDPYVILGLNRNVSVDELKVRFRELIKRNNLAGSINMTPEERAKKEAVIRDLLKAREMISREKGYSS